MLAKEIMTTEVITIHHSTTVKEARVLMNEKRIRHMPVLDEQKNVVGVFTEHDVFQAFDSNDDELYIMNKPVSLFMTTDVISAHPEEFVEDLASIFYESRIGMVPIIERGKLIGIITRSDLLYTLIQLTGAHQPSSIIQVKVENKSGKLAELAAIISQHNVNITSVLVYPGQYDHTKSLLFRVQTMNPGQIVLDMIDKGYEVLWPKVERNLFTNE